MNRLIRNTLVMLAFVLVTALVISCDDAAAPQDQSSNAAASEGAAEPLPAGLILEKSPAGAQDVIAIQKSAKVGDDVTLRGRVGGNENPLAESRAIVTLVDPSVVTCERMQDDACKTPWDACCDPDAAAKSATVQVVGTDGRPIKATLAGVGGIAPLKELIITGKVRTPSDSGALVVDATGIFVKG